MDCVLRVSLDVADNSRWLPSIFLGVDQMIGYLESILLAQSNLHVDLYVLTISKCIYQLISFTATIEFVLAICSL